MRIADFWQHAIDLQRLVVYYALLEMEYSIESQPSQ
jgi:hypothetical protein